MSRPPLLDPLVCLLAYFFSRLLAQLRGCCCAVLLLGGTIAFFYPNGTSNGVYGLIVGLILLPFMWPVKKLGPLLILFNGQFFASAIILFGCVVCLLVSFYAYSLPICLSLYFLVYPSIASLLYQPVSDRTVSFVLRLG